MNTTHTLIAIVVIIALGFGGWLLVSQPDESAMTATSDTMMEEKGGDAMMSDTGDTMMKDESAMEEKGSYEPYSAEKLALAAEGDVVLFFRASWCPTCRALDADIRSHGGDIPEGLTILDVDYDRSTALKQTYGVTYQHTLVQVDAQGVQIAKWSNSPTLADLVARVQ